MNYIIKWSNSSYSENLDNIDFLLRKWSLDVVLDYEKEIIRIEDMLLENPYIGQKIEEIDVYKILVVPQIYMLYEVFYNKIHILSIWNNYKKPYW